MEMSKMKTDENFCNGMDYKCLNHPVYLDDGNYSKIELVIKRFLQQKANEIS